MDEAKVLMEVITTYQIHVNAGDAYGYVSLFTDDVVWMPPNAPDRTSKEELLQAQLSFFDRFDFSVELTPTEARVLSDGWGFVLCSVRGELTPEDGGDPAQVKFRDVFIMKKQTDGQWKIARQMWNNKPVEGVTSDGDSQLQVCKVFLYRYMNFDTRSGAKIQNLLWSRLTGSTSLRSTAFISFLMREGTQPWNSLLVFAIRNPESCTSLRSSKIEPIQKLAVTPILNLDFCSD